MFDDVLNKKLAETNAFHDMDVMAKIASLEGTPRILDGVVKPMKFVIKAPTDLVVSAKEEFKRIYNEMYNSEYMDDECKVDLELAGRSVRKADYATYITLKSLIMANITKNLEVSNACKSLFMTLIMSNESEFTKEVLYYYLTPTGDYWSDEIKAGIMESVFTDEEDVVKAKRFFITKMLNADITTAKYTENMLRDFGNLNPDEFRKELLEIYTKALKDKTVKYPANMRKIEVVCKYLYDKQLSTQDYLLSAGIDTKSIVRLAPYLNMKSPSTAKSSITRLFKERCKPVKGKRYTIKEKVNMLIGVI